MAAVIDPRSRIIMVSGAIDRNEQTIVMRIPVPEPGEWTVTKAEVNLTDECWTAWQITLGEGLSLAEGDAKRLLLSRQFRKCTYLPSRGAILFYDGEVRPGDAVFKMARLVVKGREIVMSHNRSLYTTTPSLPYMLEHGFGDEYPKVEVIAAVRIAGENDIDVKRSPRERELVLA
jgi:hypothetical protein